MTQPDRTRFVITFLSSYDAISFEETAKAARMPGRLVPVPPEISAGCGLAWAAAAADETQLRKWLQKNAPVYDTARLWKG